MFLQENSKKQILLTRAMRIGVLALASVVALIGCADASPAGDTTPPALSVIIRSVSAASESISFAAVNPNTEAVQVTVALAPPPPKAARVSVDGASKSVADTKIELTSRNTDRERKQISITGLTNGVEYTVILITADSSGNLQPPVMESATPLASPNAPTLTIVPRDGMVALSWLAPLAGSATVTGYRVYRAEGDNGEFVHLPGSPAILAADRLTYADRSITNSSAYRYRIRAVNANGSESDPSNTATKSAHFYLHANGITIVCSGAADNATGVINGDTYTKRAKNDITAENAASSCTSGITDMSALFRSNASFNADIRHWDTSSVENMSDMFNGATMFNQNIGAWNVGAVTNMGSMFRNATDFNQDIGAWNVGAVTDMSGMFGSASAFNQDLSGWCVKSSGLTRSNFATGSGFATVTTKHPNWASPPSCSS